ncbi:MAG: hypothetical protein KAI47_19960, partial [Deltaproteobacteria bacterium]|nr:hypothetical protein [Deltaproteobacteria bacterium]
MSVESFDTRVLMVDRSRFACLRVASLLSDEPNISFHFATNLADALNLLDQVQPTTILVTPNDGSPDTSPEIIIDVLREHAHDANVVWLSEGSSKDRKGAHLDLYADKAQIVAQISRPSSSTSAQSAKSTSPEHDVESLEIEGDARVLLVDDSQVV